MLFMCIGITVFSQSLPEGYITVKDDVQTINNNQDNSGSTYKEFELVEPSRGTLGYQIDLFTSFEDEFLPEFWVSTEDVTWMHETYEGYDSVPIIDGDYFGLLFDGDYCMDTLIMPILNIQSGDFLDFYLGQWESMVTTGYRDSVRIMYAPATEGPWTEIAAIDVADQAMWDLQQHSVDVSAAAGINYLAFRFEGYFIMDYINGPARYYYTDDLMAKGLTGTASPYAGQDETYSFTVKNISSDLISGSDYTVKLMQSPNIELDVVQGVDINNWDEYTFSLTANFASAGDVFEIYAIIECATDDDISNNESNYLTVYATDPEYIANYVGDPDTDWGNYYNPFQSHYDWNCYSEVVYLKEELNFEKGEIIALEYPFHWSDDYDNVPITIWIGETDIDCMNHKHWGGPDLITSDEMYQVFDGLVNVNSTEGNLHIRLDNAFTYTGEGNLVVLMRGISDGPENNWTGWKATHVEGCGYMEYGNRLWSWKGYKNIDPTDVSNYRWHFTDYNDIPNVSILMNSNLGELNGTVTDTDGNPLEGVTVAIEETNLYSYTNANGNYILPKVLHGEQSVTASRFGYYDNTKSTVIVKDNAVTLDFVMDGKPEVSVSGQVVKSHDGQALEGASVSLTYYDYYNNVIDTLTDENGGFSLTAFSDVDYLLNVLITGYQEHIDTISVSTSNLDLGIISLDEKIGPPTNVVAKNQNDMAFVSWDIPDTEVLDTLILDDDNGMGGQGYYPNTEGWTGNKFETDSTYTIVGVLWESTGPASDTCDDFLTIDIFNRFGELIHEGLPAYPVSSRWAYYDLETPVTIEGSFYVMMHSQLNQNTSTHLTRWDWDGDVSSNYTNVIYYYSPDWPTNNGFIRVYDYDPGNGTGCLHIRPVVATQDGDAFLGPDGKTITGYNIYKGLVEDLENSASWDILNTSPIPTTEYTDTDWPPKDTSAYMYAVEALYATGTSPFGFSNALALGGVSFVSDPVIQMDPGYEYTYNVVATDSRNNGPWITADLIPDWMTLTDNGDGTAVLQGLTTQSGSYEVKLRASNGLFEDVQEFIVSGYVGIEDPIESSIVIFPNPTKNNLNIQNATGGQISIYTSTGQLMKYIEDAQEIETISMSNMVNGLYIVKVISANNITTRKITLIN